MTDKTGVTRETKLLVASLLWFAVPYEVAMTGFRREYLTQLLIRFRGNQCAASIAIGVHRNTLRRYMGELGITSPKLYRRRAA